MGLLSFLGMVSVEEYKGKITVRGSSGYQIGKEITKIWGTSRISNNIFTQKTNNSFSFYSFFLPDILYILQKMIADERLVRGRIRTLSKIRDALLKNTWIAQTDTEEYISKIDRSKLNLFKLSPMPHQDEFFDVYDKLTQKYNLNGFLFAAGAGTGKTLASMMLAYMLNSDVIIVISPKNAVNRVWEDTIRTELKNPPEYYVAANGGKLTGREKIHVYHYEALEQALVNTRSMASKSVTVILDESHNLNSTTSLRTNLFNELCAQTKSKNVIWLSGTPIKAVSSETIPLFRSIDPLFTEQVEEAFKLVHRGSASTAGDILNHRLGLVSMKVSKEVLNLNAPIMLTLGVKVPNSDKFTLPAIKDQMQNFIRGQYALYKKTEKEDHAFYYECIGLYKEHIKGDKNALSELEEYERCVRKISKTTMYQTVKDEIVFCNKFENREIVPSLPGDMKTRFKHVKSLVKYLPLKIQGECLGRIVGGARIACHVEMAKFIDFEQICETTEKKTLVFTSYVEVLQEVERNCKNRSMQPAVVYGATNSSLNKIIESVEKNEAINPLIATYDSLSTAVPITFCDVAVLVNPPFRDYVLTQAISRIHRKGTTTQTYIYSAFLDTGDIPNISTRTKDILDWSRSEVEQLMGIKSPYEIGGDLKLPGMESMHIPDEKDYDVVHHVNAYRLYIDGDKPRISAW